MIKRLHAGAIPALILLLLLLPASAFARSYHFPSVTIDAKVQEDGSMLVTEQRTASFNGTYRGMYLRIKTQGATRVSEMSVAENGKPYTYNPGTSEGPPGTYYTIEEPDRFFVDWSFLAADQTRTFTLRYRIENVVLVHQDTAELYFQFIGDEWEARADHVLVRLQLPEGANPENTRAWGHGPLHGDVALHENGQVTWEADPLPAQTFLEGRVTFPAALVPTATQHTGKVALPDILREEQQLADQANRQRVFARFLWIGAVLILFGSLFLAYWLWRHYGKEFTPSFDGDYYRDLPADYTPAELGVLWRFGKPNAEDLTATLVDLARKGHLHLDEYTPEKRGLFGGKKQDYRITRLAGDSSLAEHETKLLNFLFSEVAGGQDELTFIDLENFTKNRQTRFYKFWQDWQLTLSARGDSFFDHSTLTGKAIALGLGVIMFPLAFLAMNILSIALIAGSIVLIITGVALRRRSRQGVEDFVRWRAFRRFLLHFSEMQHHDIPSLVIWEHYLVYAITLGVAKEVIGQLQIVYPQMESGGHRFGAGWWYFHGTRGPASFTNMTNSFESFTGQINQSLRTAAGAASSGAGKGFTGGGGGGFGGGGGGAR
ncbi:MAG: DUF2207 domain-containing protein [Bacillota bacterium]|nr:DUF2207 domain-containing protein [Bacillota bacterium]